MANRIFLFIAIVLFGFHAKAQTSNHTLYIQTGQISFHPLGLNDFPFACFSGTDTFERRNSFIEIEPGTNLIITIKNLDSARHTILFEGGLESTGTILPNDSAILNLSFSGAGMFKLTDSLEKYRLLGLSTFIKVWPQNIKRYIWNLNELESELNKVIAAGMPFSSDTFNPDYFTINDNTHPAISNDSIAKVTGNVGDSIYIFVFNSGKMHHAIHFHGYHVIIVESNSDPNDIGRDKDSIPIRPGKYQVYLLVPHQEGKYPVHDHNLVATTGGGNYPNGMMVMMDIDP